MYADMYPFTVDMDNLAGAPPARLNTPITAADRVHVKDGHFYIVGPDLDPGTTYDKRVRGTL